MECLEMFKRSAAFLVLTCGFVLSMSCTLHAQVCVVDVAKVFESHPQFNAELETLKQQAEAYKLELQQSGEQLRAESEQLQNFEVGSPEYNALETKLATKSANLDVQRRNKTREFVQKEAKLHFDTYVQVTKAINDYCEQNGYRVALRFNNFEVDASNPQSIMQRVNEYVVFHQPRVDITQVIISSVGGAAIQTGNLENQNPNR